MNIQQIEYVVTAIELESYARAAEQLIVSSQAISKAVSNAERQLGQKLFVRDGRGVRATPIASSYAAIGQRVLDSYAALQNLQKKTPTRNTRGIATLALAAMPFRGEVYPICRITRFKDMFPLISINVLTYPGATCFEALKRGMADAAITLGPYEKRGFVTKRIETVDLIVVLHKSHEFAQRTQLNLTDLSSTILAYPGDIRCTHTEVEKQFQHHGIPLPHFQQVAPDETTMMAFLEKGGALLSAPHNPLLEPRNQLKGIPLATHQKIMLPVHFTFKTDSVNEALYCLEDYLISQPLTFDALSESAQ